MTTTVLRSARLTTDHDQNPPDTEDRVFLKRALGQTMFQLNPALNDDLKMREEYEAETSLYAFLTQSSLPSDKLEKLAKAAGRYEGSLWTAARTLTLLAANSLLRTYARPFGKEAIYIKLPPVAWRMHTSDARFRHGLIDLGNLHGEETMPPSIGGSGEWAYVFVDRHGLDRFLTASMPPVELLRSGTVGRPALAPTLVDFARQAIKDNRLARPQLVIGARIRFARDIIAAYEQAGGPLGVVKAASLRDSPAFEKLWREVTSTSAEKVA